MKATFRDFITEYPNCQKFVNNAAAVHVFDNILSRNENIVAMIGASKANEPALFACIKEVEAYCLTNDGQAFNLTDNFKKQALGRMVATILKPFGYSPLAQKTFPPKYVPKYVKSAHTYDFNGRATINTIIKIETK